MPQLQMDLLGADCHTKWMSSVGLISSRKYLWCIHQEELSSISSHFHSAPRALVVAASLHLTCSHKKIQSGQDNGNTRLYKENPDRSWTFSLSHVLFSPWHVGWDPDHTLLLRLFVEKDTRATELKQLWTSLALWESSLRGPQPVLKYVF